MMSYAFTRDEQKKAYNKNAARRGESAKEIQKELKEVVQNLNFHTVLSDDGYENSTMDELLLAKRS